MLVFAFRVLLLALSFALLSYADTLAQSKTAGTDANSRNAPVPLSFDFFSKGPSEEWVQYIWKTDPEYGKIWRDFQEVPHHSVAVADLNGDGKYELFARHSDELWGYCDAEEFSCMTHIYTFDANNKPIEIGKFMAADYVAVMPSKTKGFSDLKIVTTGDVFKILVWDGGKYVVSR